MKELFITIEKLEELENDYNIEDNGMSGKYIGFHWYTLINDNNSNDIIEVYTK